ncbi:MAG TPA: helix-turn-helix transcriptional regulator [Candidatus Obscuribacterales bacterium]
MSAMTIGERLKRLREDRDIQQKKLANHLGVGQATISQWESNRQEPNPKQRKKICQYFGITEAELFLGPEDIALLRKGNFNPLPPEPDSLVLSWESIYDLTPEVAKKHTKLKKGKVSVFKVQLGDSNNEPEFKVGDILEVGFEATIEDGKYYILRDKKLKIPILRQLKKYGDKIILRTTNLSVEDEFDPKRFEVIAKVLSHTPKTRSLE